MKRLEAAEAVCDWLANLLKMDMSPDLRGRALIDTGRGLVEQWRGTLGNADTPWKIDQEKRR